MAGGWAGARGRPAGGARQDVNTILAYEAPDGLTGGEVSE